MIRDTLTDEQLSALLSAAIANLEMQRIFGSTDIIEECRIMVLALEELGGRLENGKKLR
ncbi:MULTISPECIES: hypothetical protein [Enterobacteriaceae]|uniref:hypothetical protein n=1 Tax=Klebsiella oxytoca TaxID=571 RepID=UPI002931E725|nr:hypothetical protein [Klebsiella oxytoca]